MERPSCAIALASLKGGHGKTTLIANLAVCCAKESSTVVLLDYDGSLELWAERRGRGDVMILRVGDKGHCPRKLVRRLKSDGAEWMFLDLPSGHIDLTQAGIAASDLVIIPVRATFYCEGEVDSIIQICEERGKPFAFVMTRYDPKLKRSETVTTYLEQKTPGHTLPEVLSHRLAYVGSMINGQTGPEYYQDPRQAEAARAEVDALWKAVKNRALGSARIPAE
jgi:chromosome partitioning protein